LFKKYKEGQEREKKSNLVWFQFFGVIGFKREEKKD